MRFDLIIILLTGFLKRIPWVHTWYQIRRKAFANKYKKNLSFKNIRFTGINGIEILDLYYNDEVKGFIFKAEKITTRLRLAKLFDASKLISQCAVFNGEFRRIRQPSYSSQPLKADNFNRLGHTYITIAKRILQLPGKLSDSVELVNLKISGGNVSLNVSTLSLHQQFYSADFTVCTPKNCIHITANGTLSRKTGEGLYKLTSDLKFKIDQDVLDNKLQMEVELANQNNTGLNCSFKVNISSAHIQIGEKELIHNVKGTPGLRAYLTGKLTPAGFFIEKGSYCWWNNICLSFFAEHLLNEQKHIKVEVACGPCTGNHLIQSLPGFEFTNQWKAEFSGLFGFKSLLELSLNPPFNINFHIDVNQNLNIVDCRQLNLLNLGIPFLHTINQDGIPVRKIWLGNTNTDFVPLEKMSACLKKVVVFSEDRTFYTHKGIDLIAIKYAFITNLAARKIIRGASTITMQLMRNLFLYHKRNLGRKMEELLLAWLVEEVYKVSKDRILEIYLNIIEFSTDVFGIAEAARFYFSKTPEALTLTESLVLSYIIPRPKYFLEALKMGSLILVKNLSAHFKYTSAQLLKNNLISKTEYDQIEYEVVFSGGLGTLQLHSETGYLHPLLQTMYDKALALWRERHEHWPTPEITGTHQSPEAQLELYSRGRTKPGKILTHCQPGKSPHNYMPSMAFDIVFKDETGSLHSSEVLFNRFAELIAEIDPDRETVWGGNFEQSKAIDHFEIKDWQLMVQEVT